MSASASICGYQVKPLVGDAATALDYPPAVDDDRVGHGVEVGELRLVDDIEGADAVEFI